MALQVRVRALIASVGNGTHCGSSKFPTRAKRDLADPSAISLTRPAPSDAIPTALQAWVRALVASAGNRMHCGNSKLPTRAKRDVADPSAISITRPAPSDVIPTAPENGNWQWHVDYGSLIVTPSFPATMQAVVMPVNKPCSTTPVNPFNCSLAALGSAMTSLNLRSTM